MEYTFFWKGPLSQWVESYFVLDGVEYNCAEQCMMASKAILFKDKSTLEQILESESPKTQKALGRIVAGFSIDIWENEEGNGRPKCWNLVWYGNMAKFSQNPHLLEKLLKTKDTIIAEASPYDNIWGIGLRANDHRAKNRENWGRNWLGEVLMSVRDHLFVDCSPYLSTNDPRQPM